MSRRQFGRVRRLQSGRWQARYSTGDGRVRAAPQTFATEGDASRYLATVEADLGRGQYLDPAAGKMTFSQWADQWLARPGERANSVVRDRQSLEMLASDLSHRPLVSITPMHVQAIVDARAKAAAPSTVARDFSTLRAVFNAAVDADVIGRSPARKVALPRARPPARVTLSPAELEQLASAVPSLYRALVLVAGVLGLRWGEGVGLRVRDIDFLRRAVNISQVVEEVAGHLAIVKEAKTTAALRTLSVPAFLIDELAEHLAKYRLGVAGDLEALVFVGPRGGVLRRRFGERIFAPAVAKAGLDESLTFHGLRHAAISTMVELGVHPRVMQGRAGHATAKLTMELTHTSRSRRIARRPSRWSATTVRGWRMKGQTTRRPAGTAPRDPWGTWIRQRAAQRACRRPIGGTDRGRQVDVEPQSGAHRVCLPECRHHGGEVACRRPSTGRGRDCSVGGFPMARGSEVLNLRGGLRPYEPASTGQRRNSTPLPRSTAMGRP